MRNNHIINLKKELTKIKTHWEDYNEVEIIISDIKAYLNQQKVKNTRQSSIGYQVIFCSYIVKQWFDPQLNILKYEDYEKVIIIKSINFCAKY